MWSWNICKNLGFKKISGKDPDLSGFFHLLIKILKLFGTIKYGYYPILPDQDWIVYKLTVIYV